MSANSQDKEWQQDFYGRDFLITPDVLIPRPETEQLIDAILNLAGKAYLPGVKPSARILPEKPIILDVGTGSGCIAVTLKLELPEAKVFASDISEKALKIARKNADLYGTPISFIISYLLDKVNVSPDLIVANLPYVDESWEWLDKKTLSAEPSIALYANDGGLGLIKELIASAKARFLVLEADPSQHERIKKYAKKYNYKHRETRGFALVLEQTL